MKVEVKIKCGLTEWTEVWSVSNQHSDAEGVKDELLMKINGFNETLKPNELPQELVYWEIVTPSQVVPMTGAGKNTVEQDLDPNAPLIVFSNKRVDPPLEIMRFMENGDIFVHGRLAENDKEVVQGIRSMFKEKGT